MRKILIVDDDVHIRELVSALLRGAGFSTCDAADGREALMVFAEENPDLTIVDLMMPNMDGYALSKKLRQYYENKPILMLTAKAELSSKVRGFEAGADDYLVKPFEGDELLVRVRALLRRYKIEADKVVTIGATTIDQNSRTITIGGVSEDIPLKEFELLFKLAGFPGRTFTRDSLIEDIWGYDFDGNERTLDVHISRLRERFPQDRSGFKITTVRGLGYRMEQIKEK